MFSFRIRILKQDVEFSSTVRIYRDFTGFCLMLGCRQNEVMVLWKESFT